jgi:hypothetical protein
MMEMRLPGEPAIPPALAQSLFMLGTVLADIEALDMASSKGDGDCIALSVTEVGLNTSGVLMGGVDSVEVGRLGLVEELSLLP